MKHGSQCYSRGRKNLKVKKNTHTAVSKKYNILLPCLTICTPEKAFFHFIETWGVNASEAERIYKIYIKIKNI